MLVDEVLLAVGIKYHRIIVKALDNALELKPIGNVYSYRDLVLSCLVKEHVL